jgi:hypothetical protein
VFGLSAKASADPDYYEALARADASVKADDFASALRVIQLALRKYPRDYALTLKLAGIEYRAQQYAAAERSYHSAIKLSDGAIEPRAGLAWALIEQDRCDEARRVLYAVLAEEPQEETARTGLAACADRERIHGSVWAGRSGSFYQGHPWKKLSGDLAGGFDLSPIPGLDLGAAYRFLYLEPRDPRVLGFAQHEIYAQTGYIGHSVDVFAQGAMIWSGDAVVGGSRHLGASTRVKAPLGLPGSALVETSGSYYQDLLVIRVASAWTFTFGALSITPGVAVQQFAHETLAAGSLSSSLTLGRVYLWLGGKYGREYRAAYLTQFAVNNADDSADWSLLAGARLHADTHWALFASYSLMRLQTMDGLLSSLHNITIGTAYTL